jgi:hypothetical protein
MGSALRCANGFRRFAAEVLGAVVCAPLGPGPFAAAASMSIRSMSASLRVERRDRQKLIRLKVKR